MEKNNYRRFSLLCQIAFWAFVAILIVSVVLLCGSLYGAPDLVLYGAILIPFWAIALVVMVYSALVWDGKKHDEGPTHLPH